MVLSHFSFFKSQCWFVMNGLSGTWEVEWAIRNLPHDPEREWWSSDQGHSYENGEKFHQEHSYENNCQEIFWSHMFISHVWSAYSLSRCIIISPRWKWWVSWPHYVSNVSEHFYVFPHCQDLLDNDKSTRYDNFSGFSSQAVLVSLCGQSHWQS